MSCLRYLCFHLVHPILWVSMDCPFLIALSVFSNVYFVYIQYIQNWLMLPIPEGGEL
jgi:hypothetical protein